MQILFVALTVLSISKAAPQLNLGPRRPIPDGRIIGGQPVDIVNFPYQLSLRYFNSHICGGVIISNSWSATAGHCTDGLSASQLNIRAGSSLHALGGIIIQIAAIHQHPQYDPWNVDFDITVFQLSDNLSFGTGIFAVALPAQGQDWASGTNSIVSGWGTTVEGGSLAPQLQAVDVPIVGIAECRAAYGASAVTERMLCAGLPQGGQDACQGDSGGPLVVAGPVLAGLVSWGYGCARPNFPGVYSHIGALRYFITEVTGI